MTLDDRLEATFRQALQITETDVDVRSLNYRDIPEWDSLGHMALVAEIEDAFGVELDTDQVIGLSSFSVAEKLLRELGVDD